MECSRTEPMGDDLLRVVEWLQGSLLQVEVAEIAVDVRDHPRDL